MGLEKKYGLSKEKKPNIHLELCRYGGFCNMLGEEEASEEEGSFSNSSIPKRMAIVLAGAFVNIVFGLLVFFILASIINKNMYYGLIVTGRYIKLLGQSLVMLFTGSSGVAEVVGPVGISEMIVNTSRII